MKIFESFNNQLLTQNNKRGILLLVVFVFLIEAATYTASNFINKSQNTSEAEVFLLDESTKTFQNQTFKSKANTHNLVDFDPNTLDIDGWQKLGFSAKQATVILKYKYSLGGYFQNKNQIKSCFVISSWQYNKIEPYIKISSNNIELTKPKSFEGFKNQYNQKNETIKSTEKVEISFFNPNSLTKEGWEQLGFSSKQAESILKYKQAVGGTFTSKEQIKKCFVISDYMFAKIYPWIDFGLSKELNFVISKNENQSQNINQITTADLQENGIDLLLAKRIVNYRNSLGWFVNINQIKEVFGVTEKDISTISGHCKLEIPANQKKSIREMDLDALKKHPYTQKHAEYIFNSVQIGKSLQELENLSDEDKKKIYWYFQ